MPHVRIRERISNPNPHINFITALPAVPGKEDAQQLLRALAAQVRPIMKRHGFAINSLEEYEYNSVFSGRNWNNGETVELVLRNSAGSFQSISWVMSTFCHELAHIKYMNHGSDFQALWDKLRAEVRQLQDRGYFGDGYWSSGKRIADSAVIRGEGIESGQLPEFMCGGAHTRTRPTARRRRIRRSKEVVPSNSTGRQTAKKRKAGSRVTSKYSFTSPGTTLDSTGSTTFRKQAGSNRAREERALAAENRLKALEQGSGSKPAESDNESDSGDIINETDAERRTALLDSEQGDVQRLKTVSFWHDLERNSVFADAEGPEIMDPEEDSTEREHSCDIPVRSGTVYTQGPESCGKSKSWGCQVCTLLNEPTHLACSACATPRGDAVWTGSPGFL